MTKQIIGRQHETKRINLVHPAIIDAHCTPVQRRLRKMKDEFQPVSFSSHVQVCWLCVGMSVVYRVSLSLSMINSCPSQTTRDSITSTSNDGHTTQSTCVIAMSQTKFCRFYAQISTILHHPAVEQQVAVQHQDDPVDWKPFQEFLRILAKVFQQYEQLQYSAFTIQADANTMNASKLQLEGFVSACWNAVENVFPALVVESFLPASLKSETLSIYLLMRDFLLLPETVLDANRTYANAVLSLDDVELLPTHLEHSCSICLEPLVKREMVENNSEIGCRFDNMAKTNGDFNEDGPSALDGCAAFAVKLPCAHVYHENCIMSWMRHNPSCPECRALVSAEL